MRIRLCNFKSLVVFFGIASLVLIARRSLHWKRLLLIKDWSTFYQERVTISSSHPPSTFCFIILKFILSRQCKQRACKSICWHESSFNTQIRHSCGFLNCQSSYYFLIGKYTCYHFETQN